MTRTRLSGQKIAIMVANGFDEKNFVEIQKMLMTQNVGLKVVSPNSGLVNGRNGDQAGISYPVDSLLSDTLAIDYDALVIPSGRLHTASLKDELHAIRIIRAFLREGMPVLVQDDALDVICEINDEIDGDVLRRRCSLIKPREYCLGIFRCEYERSVSHLCGKMPSVNRRKSRRWQCCCLIKPLPLVWLWTDDGQSGLT